MDSPRSTSRRTFIAAAFGSPQSSNEPTTPEVRHGAADDAPYLVRYGRQAMASDFQVLLVAGQDEQGGEAALDALDRIDAVETQLTVYRESSEVLEINRRAAREAVVVEPRLFALIERGVELYRETGGAYDITSGPLSKVWGFSRRQGRIPDAAELAAALANVGSDKLDLDHRRQTIRFLVPGIEINLNSIGKGYALDRAAEALTERGIANFALHGGQSSVLARGTPQQSKTSDVPGWPIGIGHPLGGARRLAELVVVDQAVGTSGAGFQFFRHQGKRYGHLLDPRTGSPAEGVFSVSVTAPTAAEADALSTAFYVMGYEASRRYCEQHPDVGFVMLMPGTTGGSIELATCNLDERQLRLL